MPLSPPAPLTAGPKPLAPAPVAEAPARPVRVLHVINGEHYSGAERVQDLLAAWLPEFGYEVGFAALKPGRFGDCREAVQAPLVEHSMRGRFDLRPSRAIARQIREEDYDLIHAHTPRSLVIAATAAHRTGKPLVYHVHSPASRDSTRRFTNLVNDGIERWFGRSAKQLITVSPTLTDHMLGRGFSADRLRCVMNGVPGLEENSPGARRRRKPVGPLVIGMVALFRPRKGAEVLLEALATLRSHGHEVRLEAIGPFETPEYEAKLHELVDKLALTDLVHWAGFTDDVHAALARIDTLALPSLFGEGLPMVVLEAMAAGLPVVATRCEGTAEAILHRETGLLVEPGSVSQMTSALEEIIAGRIEYEDMSIAARERHADRFSARAMARQVAAVYDTILKPA
ncbi:glycosyltransferase [Botrimarina hoheduenensis]|uniref:Putative glycosyltransferase EpsD n=1 Tax=Botrimarina hoheduenensis TaxID=2528000 RepID=A0A5C5WBC3_9BACT|nr:glycosyltransferase [Botrimarina hoheduenensis]TWT46922.1 putative glycosyltransferase EpsD [Botrimarina hoheduenensis]